MLAFDFILPYSAVKSILYLPCIVLCNLEPFLWPSLELVGDLVGQLARGRADVEIDIAILGCSPFLEYDIPYHDILAANREVRGL